MLCHGDGEHVHAAYDALWYLDDHPFLPTHASRLGAMTTIHSWIFNGNAQHYGGMSQQSVRHAEYLVELSQAFATDPARRVWLQEVGAPLNCLAETDAPAFCADTVRAAADTTGLWGRDVVVLARREPTPHRLPRTRILPGVVRRGGPKPIALRYAETARELRAAGTAPLTPTLAVEVAVDADDVPLSRSALAPGGVIFEEWTRLALAGPAPGTRDLGRRGGSRGACCPRDPRGDPGTAATRGGQYAAVSDG